jgi:hypothetical protein
MGRGPSGGGREYAEGKLEVLEDSPGTLRAGLTDGRDNGAGGATALADQDLDAEHPVEKLHPGARPRQPDCGLRVRRLLADQDLNTEHPVEELRPAVRRETDTGSSQLSPTSYLTQAAG